MQWTDEQTFRLQLTRAKDEVREQYETLINELVKAQRLTPMDALSFPAQIDVTVQDHRVNPQTPLPEID